MPRRLQETGGAIIDVGSTGGVRAVQKRGIVSEAIVQDLLRSVSGTGSEHVRTAEFRDILAPTQLPAPAGRTWRMPNLIPQRPWSLLPWVFCAVLVVAGLLVVSNQGLHIRRHVINDGGAAVGQLVSARAAVERFDFAAAADGFSRAYEQFGQARDDLGIFNTRLGGILAQLPGGGRIQSAQDLIRAGELLAHAGKSMSELVNALGESGSILDPANDGRSSFAGVLSPMQEALTEASDDLAGAAELLNDVDPAHVPPEQRGELAELSAKLPELQALVDRAAGYVKFLEDVVATDGEKSYLLLFQNSTELRPTGGFPGSYGVAVFRDGRLESFEADDVYNPDGQIKELIVPPRALQHITPDWGLRDSTWFVDFPTSARKAAEMFRRGSGRPVQGVLAFTPEIIRGLLHITGPVSLPEYDLVLNEEDFLPKLQSEVEYGINKQVNKPKKIIMDLAPIVLRKLYQAPRSEWLKALGVFSEGLAERDIMMYFPDPRLQGFVGREGFDGAVHQGGEDFLMVAVANVAGAKADAVTDTKLNLRSRVSGEGVAHRLVISRKHEGGDSDYGFYNQPNRSYVRVLVPDGSRLTSITGNEQRGFRPVARYGADAVRDPDLEAMEGDMTLDENTDVATWHESGKTAFGFWVTVSPGSAKEVILEWAVPASYAGSDYSLYVQKQPGLRVSEFRWELQGPRGARLTSSEPALRDSSDGWVLQTRMDRDIPLRASFE